MNIDKHDGQWEIRSAENWISENTGYLDYTLERLFHEGKPSTISLDMSQVEFMDSLGVKCLIRLHKRCEQEAIPLTILSPSNSVQRIFHVCGIHQLVDVK